MTEKVKVPILTQIQNELKAPKSQYNGFGKYKYRNAEDIEQALKPLLAKYGATLTIDEDVRMVGERIYFVETARYKDAEQEVSVQGWAREALNKKGMDDSQISGATSSYAVKYALAKLFLIDDTQDTDSNGYQRNQQQAPVQKQKPVRRQAVPRKPKKMTKDQLYGYQADYNGEKKFLVTIYTECDKQKKMGLDAKTSVPIEWWHEKLKENSADGEAVRQFTEMAIAANQKKQAKAKIEQSNSIPDYAKDPEVEKAIEEAIS